MYLLKDLMHCLKWLLQCFAFCYACLLNKLLSNCKLAFMEKMLSHDLYGPMSHADASQHLHALKHLISAGVPGSGYPDQT